MTTNARPEQVQALFEKTLPVGAAFGVIIVLVDGDQIEVATFRSDGTYGDGRRPDSVEYGKSAKEDVQRRDFTMNGMLYGNLRGVPDYPDTCLIGTDGTGIIDYVGGLKDCQNKVINCIGEPADRFAEDALRMLRAVRFAAQLGFEIEKYTLEAITANAPKIVNVSRERVAAEMFKLLTAKHPLNGLVPLFSSGLAAYLFPRKFIENIQLVYTLQRFRQFQTNDLVLAMTMFLADTTNAKTPLLMCQNLKLSNEEKSKIVTALLYVTSISNSRQHNLTPASYKRTMRQPGIENALEIAMQDEVIKKTNVGLETLMSIINDYKKYTRDEIYPKPLVTGDDLIAAGLTPSPLFREVLFRVEEGQLDGLLTDRETALSLALELAGLTGGIA